MIHVIAGCVIGFMFCLVIVFRPVVATTLARFNPRLLLGSDGAPDQLEWRHSIVHAFLVGMSRALIRGRSALTALESQASPFERPFMIEGMCAGLALRQVMTPWKIPYTVAAFRGDHSDFEFLSVIGLGFGAGLAEMLGLHCPSPDKAIQHSLKFLWADGYGFQRTIFLYFRGRGVSAILKAASRSRRPGYYEGVGRALWFLLPSIQSLSGIGIRLNEEHVNELFVGYGIAAGFAGCANLKRVTAESNMADSRFVQHYKVGVLVGLFARYYTNQEHLSALLRSQCEEGILDILKIVRTLYIEIIMNDGDSMQWFEALRGLIDLNPHFIADVSTGSGAKARI